MKTIDTIDNIERMVVPDAAVLIALAKLERLRLLNDVYGDVITGPVVKEEVVDRGRAIAASEADQVAAAYEEGSIRLVRLARTELSFMQDILKTTRLAGGEAESIALARSRGSLLVVDDKEARSLAAAMRIDHIGTAGVLLEALESRKMSLEEFEEAVFDLSKVLWLSPALVIEMLRRARENLS